MKTPYIPLSASPGGGWWQGGPPQPEDWQTPARAGEPYHPGHLATEPAVYPRVCGGTILAIITINVDFGLSPYCSLKDNFLRERSLSYPSGR